MGEMVVVATSIIIQLGNLVVECVGLLLVMMMFSLGMCLDDDLFWCWLMRSFMRVYQEGRIEEASLEGRKERCGFCCSFGWV